MSKKDVSKPFIFHHHLNGVDNGAKLAFPVDEDGNGFSEEAAVAAAAALGYQRRGVSVHYKLTTDGNRVFDHSGHGGEAHAGDLVRCNVLSVYRTSDGSTE